MPSSPPDFVRRDTCYPAGDTRPVTVTRPSYQASRPYTVVAALEELHGPTTGRVHLPDRLAWSGQREFNVEDPHDREALYMIVLREAMHPEDLQQFLDHGALLEVWPDLWLPVKTRQLWESRFPQLATG